MKETQILSKMDIRLVLAGDDELVEELKGTTETKSSTGRPQFHPPVINEEHNTDAACYMMLAILAVVPRESQQNNSLDELGWIGEGNGSWSAPYGS